MTDDPLKSYRAKRDFGQTPEPSEAGVPAQAPRFVIHEHHASHLHWDLRLEHDGVLVSWAVPKGIPLSPVEKRLAIHVEDHPLSYIHFEGTIPKGQYGAGTVWIYDEGLYEAERFDQREVSLTFHGARIRGRYVLFQTHDTQWILKRRDPASDTRDPLPPLKPMLARLGPLPRNEEDYAFEIKWDGIRALAEVSGGRVRLLSRNQRDVTAEYPEIRALADVLGAREAVLDGEIVTLLPDGRPSFSRLQKRMGHTPQRSGTVLRDIPVVYMIFDVLYLDGKSLVPLAYDKRRAMLESLGLDGAAWQTPKGHRGSGSDFLAATRAQGLEGVVAKYLSASYEPGLRTGAWLKIKNGQRQEFVIGGFREGVHEPLGALLLGYYDEHGSSRLRYAGAVGTGFSRAVRSDLLCKLKPRVVSESPFREAIGERGVVFVTPDLVCEVSFHEWTQSGVLRHASYHGLRSDKAAADVMKEVQSDGL